MDMVVADWDGPASGEDGGESGRGVEVGDKGCHTTSTLATCACLDFRGTGGRASVPASDFPLRDTTGDGERVLSGSAIVADGSAGESGSGVDAGDAGRSGIVAGLDFPVDEVEGVVEFTVSLLALAASFARILSSRVVRGRGAPSTGLPAGLEER